MPRPRSGWFQAGNLGGQGLGGGLGLWLIQGAGWGAGGAGGVLAAVCVLCCLALRWVDDARPLSTHHAAGPDRAARPALVANARAIAGDLWQLVRSRTGALAVVICFLPIGSGAAQNLWATVAGTGMRRPTRWPWSTASRRRGLGIRLHCRRLALRPAGSQTAYCLFGAAQMAAAIAMGLSARTSGQFVLWTTVYAFIQGLTYAGYSAIVLEAIGRTAAATKFSLLAALSNMPIAYVTLIDGNANDRWGTRGMLLAEAVCGAVGIVIFLTLAAATKRRSTPALA